MQVIIEDSIATEAREKLKRDGMTVTSFCRKMLLDYIDSFGKKESHKDGRGDT